MRAKLLSRAHRPRSCSASARCSFRADASNGAAPMMQRCDLCVPTWHGHSDLGAWHTSCYRSLQRRHEGWARTHRPSTAPWLHPCFHIPIPRALSRPRALRRRGLAELAGPACPCSADGSLARWLAPSLLAFSGPRRLRSRRRPESRVGLQLPARRRQAHRARNRRQPIAPRRRPCTRKAAS